jgi:hypothetical protein
MKSTNSKKQVVSIVIVARGVLEVHNSGNERRKETTFFYAVTEYNDSRAR